MVNEYVVFDLEANADRSDPPAHEIIEIGAVFVVDGAESTSFSTLVRPTRPLRSQTRELTGLTDEDLTQAPTLTEALLQFAAFVGNRPLMAHNGFGYDFPLLDTAAEQSELPAIGGIRLDTLELAHLAFPAGWPRHGPGRRRQLDLRRGAASMTWRDGSWAAAPGPRIARSETPACWPKCSSY